MADFNSRYTGAEIEAAIAKTDKIGEFVEIWAGTPTNSPISLSSLPVNPGTGDRTGLYYVYSSFEDTGATAFHTASLYVSSESGRIVGSGSGGMDSGWISLLHVQMDSAAGGFKAEMHNMDVANAADQKNPMNIYKIFRFQQAQ